MRREPVALGAEWLPARATRELRHAHDDALAKLGVPAPVRQGLGAARIVTKGRFWAPDEAGTPAVLVPAFGLRDAEPEDGDDAEIVDLVAFDLDRPAESWVRTGGASYLGALHLEDTDPDEPLNAFATPLAWLIAGCDGVVVIDWAAARRDLIGRTFVADTIDLGQKLRRELSVSYTPRILIAQTARRVAA